MNFRADAMRVLGLPSEVARGGELPADTEVGAGFPVLLGVPAPSAPKRNEKRMSERPKGAFIEIVEKVKPGEIDGATIFPTEIRINGTPVLAPASEAVIVHEMSVPSDDLVKVTMTVFARRVSMFQEEATS